MHCAHMHRLVQSENNTHVHSNTLPRPRRIVAGWVEWFKKTVPKRNGDVWQASFLVDAQKKVKSFFRFQVV